MSMFAPKLEFKNRRNFVRRIFRFNDLSCYEMPVQLWDNRMAYFIQEVLIKMYHISYEAMTKYLTGRIATTYVIKLIQFNFILLH